MLKKNKWLLLFAILLLFITCGEKDNTPEEQIDPKFALSGKTAAEYFADNGLTLGWNVGNTLDAPALESGWLTADNRTNINQALLNGVKTAGFNVLRIPITWNVIAVSPLISRPIGPEPDYQLNQRRLNRVVEVVDMAYEAGFKAVIINVHHDGNPEFAGQPDFWTGDPKADSFWLNFEGEEVTAKFSKVWEQIAEKFKDYGDWLIFEGINEPRKNTSSWGWDEVVDADMTKINEWNQAFTDAVRGIGGNNTERFLIIQPYAARVHLAIDERFILPTDPTPGKQIVSMHWYYPQRITTGGSDFYDTLWGSEFDKSVIVDGSSNPNTGNIGFEHFKEKYTSKGIPVIIGECGASVQMGTNSSPRNETQKATAEASRLAYTTYLCEEAKARGLVPVIWDNGSTNTSGNGENFGLFKRSDGQPLNTREDTLIKAMVNAVK